MPGRSKPAKLIHNYYGITVANGIISSPESFKVKDVVLAGAYDLYDHGRGSNFLRNFNLLNMYLEVDTKRIDAKSATNMTQELDMRKASFTTTFDYTDKAIVTYTYYSLRHLPYTVLMNVVNSQKRHQYNRRKCDGSSRCVERCSELL